MFTKSAIALAITLGITSAAFAGPTQRPFDPNAAVNAFAAATPKQRQHSANPAWDVYDWSGRYLGSDPDARVRENMLRDHNNE